MEYHNLINHQLQERCQPKMAIHLLENVAEDKCLTNPPYQPGHGDWYVFSYVETPERKRSWQNDGHQWRNYGLRKEFYQDRLLYKRYFRQINSVDETPSSLTRLVYELVAPLTLPRFLVQYFDERQAPSKVCDRAVQKKTIGRKKLPASRHGCRKDANRRQLLTELKDSDASRMLLSKMSCCASPANRPTNGYWYIYKFDGAEGRSDNWQDDGLVWRQQHSSVVTVGEATMLKRRYVRLVNGAEVDFHRHCYQFVSPAAASLASLTGGGADTSTAPSLLHDENTIPVHTSFNSSSDGFAGLFQYDEVSQSPQKQKARPGATKKRRVSRRWSPVKKAKKKKKAVQQEEESGDEDRTGVPLQRVLIHYLGNDDASNVDKCIKKINRVTPQARHQVALCRAVPLTCTDSTLQTANIGPNRGIYRRLNAREATRLLITTPSHSVLPCLPLLHPKAGLWCVLNINASQGSVASSPQDGFTWRPVGKAKHSVGEHTLLLRRYRRMVRGQCVLLYRYVYSLPDSATSQVLVHYTGLDDEVDCPEADGEASPPCKMELGEDGVLKSDDTAEDKDWPLGDDEGGKQTEDVTTVLNKKGLSVMVITKLLMPLEMESVVHLLEDTPEEDCLTFAPSHPRNGHWYVFSFSGLPTACHMSWRRDCTRWRHNGTHSRNVHGKNVNIRYYKRVVPGSYSSFLRYVYEILDGDGNNSLKRMLVHYLGADDDDQTLQGVSRRLKGNLGFNDSVVLKVGDIANDKFYTVECKTFVPDLSADGVKSEDLVEEDPMLRQAVSSILEADNSLSHTITSDNSDIFVPITELGSKGTRTTLHTGFDCSNNFYYEEVVTTTDPSLLHTTVFEDVSTRYASDDGETSIDSGMPFAYRMSRSTLESLHEFIHKITHSHSLFYQLLPSTIVVMVSKYNVNEFKSIAADDCCSHVLFYDRMWRVGDLRISCLYAKHSFCETETVFPLAFSIYELDDFATHCVILEQVLRHCPSLNAPDVVLLTDCSPSVIAACNEVCPKSLMVSSWTNIAGAIKLWFTRNDATSEHVTSTVESVHKLLKTFSISEYNACFQEASYYWSPAFKAFYDESLSSVVMGSHADSLKRLGMYSELGLTIGGSLELVEQIGNILNDSDESSIDVLSTMVYYVLYHYQNEIEKGKLKVVGTAFNRKADYLSRFNNRKSFFPTRCALTDDVTAVILYKMHIKPLAVTKRESENLDNTEEFRELINIEFDLDDELRAAAAAGDEGDTMVGEFFHQITIDEGEVSPVILEETITAITDGDDFEYRSSLSDVSEEAAPVVEGREDNTTGLRVASDLFEQATYMKSKNRSRRKFQQKNQLKTNGLSRKRLTKFKNTVSGDNDKKTSNRLKGRNQKSIARGRYYNMRRMVVKAGHNIWEEGGVSHEHFSDTYIVRGDSKSLRSLNAVRLLSGERHECSCSSTKRRCEHVVAAMLEKLCQEEEDEEE